MQLKFKKICLLSTIVVYCASFLLQSNLPFFETWAADMNAPRVNIVAILVDDNIYGGISGGLQWYASEYVQQQLSDTKALVMPLDLSNISAYDIHRMMENIYFDGLENVNSSLIGLIMVGDIPLPVVNQDGYIFPTVYPYVDFENQKYIWDEDSQYFVPNNNPAGQAEIWHGLINYGSDVESYQKFFEKIQKYIEDPDNFIGDAIWYEDFIASKEGFLNENYPYYRNKIMFGEDLSYQRYSPLMKKMFYGESTDTSVDLVEDLGGAITSAGGDASSIMSSVDPEMIETLKEQGSDGMHTTKMIQQEIEDSFLADYDDLFSKTSLSTMRENVLAGGRWIRTYTNTSGQATLLANVDSSSSMIQLKDTMYLGNQNVQGLLENLNELMEEMIDKKIDEEKYSMDIVVPLEYKLVTGKRIDFKCRQLTNRFENFYFGSNARYIDSAKELSIYRGTYRNLRSLNGVTYDSLLTGNNPVVSEFDKTDVKLKSIGASYDIFSDQVEGNRGYSMLSVDGDLDTYDENKTTKKRKTEHKGIFGRLKKRTWPEVCGNNNTFLKRLFKGNDDCESLHDFAKRWWGGASAINLITESVSKGRYELDGYLATDSWRSIYSMGGFQSLLSGEDEGMFGKGWYYGTGEGPQWAGTSFKSYIKYSSPTQREGWGKVFWGYEIYENHTPDVHKNFNEMNYWRLGSSIVGFNSEWAFSTGSAKVFNIDRIISEKVMKCGGSERYSYKVINSIVKHDSTSEDEINGIDKERYGESGIWSVYYNDIKGAYVDVDSDMKEIIDLFPGLQTKVEEIVAYINKQTDELGNQGSSLSSTKNEISRLNSEKSGKIDDNTRLRGEITDLEFELSNVVCMEEESWVDDDGNEHTSEVEVDDCQEKKDLRDAIDGKMGDIEDNNGDIKTLDRELNGEEKNRKATEAEIKRILNDVSNYLVGSGEEKDKITDMYKLIMGLYVENIIGAMEYIIYVEGGNPEDYYSDGTGTNLVKIGFLPSWMSEIKNIENSIKVDSKKIISSYNQVYSGIMHEKEAWADLADTLKSISDENDDNIDRVTEQMNNILTLSNNEEDGEVVTVTLTGGTARSEMNNLYKDFERVGTVYGKLVEEDKIGPEVARLAKEDTDFRNWLFKKSIDYQSFTVEDWIVQYSNWTKGDGYDSTGARVNHDLLLGVSEHMSGMNILTPDRPIDSPRYVSMQSIAGNEIKLIYPDLFKVEVYVLTGQNKSGYDIHELLTGGQIRENLVKYLSGKVDEYNKILENEYKSAKLPSDIYNQRLLSLGFNLATPDKSVRPYQYFTYEDFEDALGGSGMLDVISEMLYYQSLTNKKKLSTGGVAEDIELIKKSFSLNDKREWILKDYLTEWTGEDFKTNKNPLLVIPTYELSGYEVAYVNSDGKDYIIPVEEDVDTTSTKVESKIRRHQPIKQEEDFDEECNIPPNGKLPLFKLEGLKVSSPWYEGFKCRWEYTKKHPAKIELTFDRSLGEVIVSSGFKTFMESLGKAYISETKEEFTAWGDQMTKYADARDSLLTPGTGYDADKDITQMQVEAEKHNVEVNAGGSNVSTVSKNVKISNSNALLSDSNPSSLLRIEPIKNLNNITVVFMGTGDGCINVDGSTLCKGATTSRTFSKEKPFSGLVKSADHVAGKLALDIKIYGGGGGYYEKVLKYTVSPSMLDNFEIKVLDEETVAGMVSPMEVIGYDKYGNRVNWGLEKYIITASQGEFLKDGAYQPEIITNDFRNLRLYYKAPLNLEGDKDLIEMSKYNGDGAGKSVVVKPSNPYEQSLVDGAPLVKLNGTQILRGKTELLTNQTYKLRIDESIYDESGKLDKGKLQKLDIEIEDLKKGGVVDVDEQILVTSQNGLVYIGQVQKDENGVEMFFETSKNYFSGGKVTVYYYPSTVAGDEVIRIDIPGLETRVINLSIKPNDIVANIETVLEKDVLYLGDTMNFELFLADKWGNLIDHPDIIGINYDEDKIEFVDPKGGKDGYIEIVVNNGYGKYTIFGTGAGLAFLRAGGEAKYFNVDKHIFPDSGLNIMYLNYFGNDWGNQWGYFSDNNHHVENLMAKSNKIITTTTQLVSEDKIKKMIWKIEPGFKIWNPDNMSTVLTIKGNQVSMVIGDVTSMESDVGSLTWMQVTQDTIDSILNNGSKKGGSYAFFIPSDLKYSIDKSGTLFSSGAFVANIANGDVGLQLSTSFTDDGDNIWKLIYKGINYGNLIIHYSGFSPKVGNFVIPGERYVVDSTFTNGSTYKLNSVGIFDLLSNFKLNTSYKSIQNSDELGEKIGFLGDFKNITLFAEGEIVGEATRKFGSEFVINLGDPVLSRKSLNENVYGTDYDGGIGQEIYSDPENNIFGTYEIDFDSNGTKDLLVVYLDGSIKLAKNYGGVPDLRNMQELMRIAIPIKEVFVGDTDGQGGDDIIILTKNNQLRVYLNNGGMFDVDGRVACLNQNVFGGEVSSTPSNLEGIYQIFVEDMNKDKKVDVVTYDNKGYIKVFYGGSTKNGPNYLSRETYACDTGWYNREASNITVVDALGVSIDGSDVFDNSMLHWNGMVKPEIEITEDKLSEYGININLDDVEKGIKERTWGEDGSIDSSTHEIMDKDKFDVQKASQKFIDESAKFVDVTLYENRLMGGGDTGNYVFAPSSYLDPGCAEDIGSVWKNYRVSKGGPILQDGDIVTVTVTVKAGDGGSFEGAFGDIIQGPWNLYYDENKILKSIRFTQNKRNAVIKQRDGNFAYIIDNISLGAGEEMKFEYDLEYRSVPLRKMEITYETFYSDDELPDIKLQSIDGCVKDFDVYINLGKSFSARDTILLQDMINDTYENEDAKTEDYAQDVIDAGSDVNQLPGIVGDALHRISLLDSYEVEVSNDDSGKKVLENAILKRIEEGGLEGLNMNLNVDLSIFEEQTNAIEDVIDDITKGMCNGFQFGGTSNCPGLPVPFNQAFLAPGKYHLFGCWNLPLGKLEKGLPVFHFPGTFWAAEVPVPIPRGLKSDLADGFIWAGGGSPTYPSFIRIYAAPTLTAQLGIAICLGPYAVGKAIPSPFADLGGNCIVFAIKPQCSNSVTPKNLESPYESYSEFVEEVRDSGVCLQSQKGPQVTEKGYNSSPTRLNSFNSSRRSSQPSREDIKLSEKEAEDILGDIQRVVGNDVNVREIWDNALKPLTYIPLSFLDKLYGRDNVDQATDLYDKYFGNARLTVADNYPVDYSVSADLGIINLEREAYVATDDSEVKNSIMIGDVDILGGEYDVNKIKGGIQQGLRKVLIDKWLDPQIRYILNQLTKMHVEVILPDLSDLMGGDLTTITDIATGAYDFTIPDVPEKRYQGNAASFTMIGSDYKGFVDNEKNAMNNIKGGLGGLFNDYGNNVKDYQLSKSTAWSGKKSTWDWYSKESLNDFNSKLGNPFEALASLMNESNIINISTETLTVKVPMIFSEDINEYQFYLNQWLEENGLIMQEWEKVLNTVLTNCSKEPVEKQEACRANAQKNLSAFIEFKQGDWQNMVNNIYTNLMILQEYRNFPFEMYEWIHVIDRYMSEIASLINNTVGYLSYWVVANSERFVGYIDAITLILNIIKTYQLIIDFSVERSNKCGNCAKDTYDQYSCKLSFLCDVIQLPIIQIPNFKLPNITIDLSNIDIGLDIILPEFNFQPVKINLPDIPNLPEPPSIGVDIKLFDLPNIPILPEPPTLPELPSFIPEVEIELPMLPPAPELPELPNKIEGIIKVAGLIGKIYCIVKKGFGLVGEGSVKAKIEQITQRTYDVKWIDNIMDFTNWSPAPLKNYGVDYEISSYIDLQFTMDDFYDYLDVLTKGINNLTETATRGLNDGIGNNKVANGVAEVLDGVNGMNLNIQLGMASSEDSDLQGLTSDEIKYVDYSKAKDRLNEVLAYFKNELNKTTFTDSIGGDIKSIENDVNKPSVVIGNTEGIDNMKNEIMNYLDGEKVYYDDLANLINKDYDGFLAMVDSQNDNMYGESGDKLLTFNVQLFNLDPSTKETVKSISKTNPYRSLIENKQEIIDGYWNAINSNTSDSLGLTEREYLVLRNNIGSMKEKISMLYSITVPASSTQLIAKNGGGELSKSLVAAGEGARIGSNTEVAKVIDPSVFSNGVYEKMTEGEEAGKLTKVVNSDSFVEDIGSNFKDTNRFGPHDIILRDEDAIYKKCASQMCNAGIVPISSKYYVQSISSIPYEEAWVKFDKDTILKIADGDVEVKNWKVTGQSYDMLSFSWDLYDVEAYLIKLVERIDYSYEKTDHKSRVSYILALPNGVELADLIKNQVKLELLKDNGKKKSIKTIEDLYGKDLVEVVYYDSNKDIANIMISNIDRKWYYGRISALDFNSNDNTYYINSPWSNQVVAGKQVLGDAKGGGSDQPPEVEQELFRPTTNEVVSEGDSLEGYVGTKYILNMYWEDNVALSYINVSQNGKILTGKYTSEKKDMLSIDIDMHFYEEEETYNLYGVDQFGNETEKVVTIAFSIPTIKVTDVSKNIDGETVDITAELSQTIDEGNVSFQRKRGSSWKIMKRKYLEYADFSIGPWDKVVVGTGYSFGNWIAMYDKDDSVIALMNPDTAEIKLQSGYEDKFDVNVKVVNSAVLYLYDKEAKENKFSVSIPTDSCVNIQSESESYKVVVLPKEGNMGMFNGGTVVYKDGNIILMASPTCHLYSEYGLDGTYSYDKDRDAVLLELYEPSDLQQTSPIRVWLKTKSFLPK